MPANAKTILLVEDEAIIAMAKKMTLQKYGFTVALAHSRDLMRYVIEHNRSAVAVHDRNLKYVYVSKKYMEDYNIKEPDIIGRHHYDVFPDLPQRWRDVHQKALAGEVSSAEDDVYKRADGSIDWTRWECRQASINSTPGIAAKTDRLSKWKYRPITWKTSSSVSAVR